MDKIAVYCGSCSGTDPIYSETASLLGKTLALNNIELVYGGARVGLMGAVADGALAHQGKVTGILPRFLHERELVHPGLTELILVDTMHERKAMLSELSDGMIALPGGYGTFEELFEVLAWGQLGLHKKPVGLLTINGFYDSLLLQIATMAEKGFMKEENLQRLLCSDSIEVLLDRMGAYIAPVG